MSLPDLVRANLDVVFVGINPSSFSVAQGHYFARKTNRFWPCFSASKLSLKAREATGLTRFEPVHDRDLLDHGFGFTDAVKRASPRASDISPAEFCAGVETLLTKLHRFRPKVACFHGIMAYRPVHRALTLSRTEPVLGAQSLRIGATRLYLVPNPSPANAHFTASDQTKWYDQLDLFLRQLSIIKQSAKSSPPQNDASANSV
ncbi:MAG TPA: mismatch-specific DNA-glycosylase [Methylocella sp.]|nr:mismatch-specific DNA-glycosylase [Methylocella sp.]